ncbi:MAG: c-type cytochrome [Acidobacteria bacterium]|nr:c-type cytochrome [Acidobacteriota bacterium]
MSSKRVFLTWVAAAVAALALLLGVLFWEHKSDMKRWTSLWVGDPHMGARLFFERKGCAYCHPVNGYGGKGAPDMGFTSTPQSSLSQLVAAMWNCAPRMWERMRVAKTRFPDLNQEEMSHLFAFLYTAKYVDESGDADRGERLLRTKGCVRCHAAAAGADQGPDLTSVRGVDTPILWTQAMWNHAPMMETRMQQQGLTWPKFEGRDMNDLLAYIRTHSGGTRREYFLFPANPERGWKLFQSKSCIVCHSVAGKGGHVGPELGPGRPIPITIVQFAALMWNHSPEMWKQQVSQSIPRPRFEGQEIADLVAFLAGLRYFEPAGSEQVGKTVFAERNCSRCHGDDAQGSRHGPALRGRGDSYSTIRLATSLWRHGPSMYRRTQELKIAWPSLAESDVGNLVSFLNAPLEAAQR